MSIRPRLIRLILLLVAAASLAQAQTNVSRLLTELRSPYPAVRDSAVQQLAMSHSGRAIQPLIDALNDSNLRVAQDAATALGQLRSVAAVQPLIDSLHHNYCSGIVSTNPHAAAALSAIGMPAVPTMLEAISNSSYGVSGDISSGLIPAFDGIQSPDIVQPLAALLHSPNDQARIYAADRLAKHPGAPTVDALLPALHDPNEFVRFSVIVALGENLQDPRVEPALRAVVMSAPEKNRLVIDEQVAAMRQLAKLHDPALIPVFIAAMQFSDATIGGPPGVTEVAAFGPVAIQPLIDALQDTSRPAVIRGGAALALGQFDDPRIIPPLLAYARDSSKSIQKGVMQGKVVDTDPAFTDMLLDALHNDTWARIRQLAGYDLADHNDPRVNPALIAALKDPDENVRAAAANSLGKRRATEAIPQLVDYMHGKTTLDHQQGAEALGAMRDPSALEAVREMRRRSKGGDRIVASEALDHLEKDLYGKKNSPEHEELDGSKGSLAFERAILALNSPEAHDRLRAAETLSDIGHQGVHLAPRAIEPLIHALDDPDQEIARRAAIALSNVDDTRKIEPFTRLLHSTDFALREYAANGLAQVHDPRAVPPLIAALSDPDFNTHRGLMNALQHDPYPPVLPALLAALRSPNAVVRASAAEALRYRTEPNISRALISLERDRDLHVREAAQQALSGCPPPPIMD
jgi:HEAT repeat protein